MSQPKVKLRAEMNVRAEMNGDGFKTDWTVDVIEDTPTGHWRDPMPLGYAKTEKTAYKRAARKLRQLADEAERLADE